MALDRQDDEVRFFACGLRDRGGDEGKIQPFAVDYKTVLPVPHHARWIGEDAHRSGFIFMEYRGDGAAHGPSAHDHGRTDIFHGHHPNP